MNTTHLKPKPKTTECIPQEGPTTAAVDATVGVGGIPQPHVTSIATDNQPMMTQAADVAKDKASKASMKAGRSRV